MIDDFLEYTKRYYPISFEYGNFTVETDGITGSFLESYVVGQYINIELTKVNNGTYKITEIEANKLVLDSVLLPEVVSGMNIWGLAIPKQVLSLVAEIESMGLISGLASESQGNRSVSYSNGSNWTDIFKSRIKKSIYNDKDSFARMRGGLNCSKMTL